MFDGTPQTSVRDGTVGSRLWASVGYDVLGGGRWRAIMTCTMQGSDVIDQLEQLSYCGLDCGTCYVRNGHIADHATALLAEFKAMRFEKWGPPLATMNQREFGAFRHAQDALEVLEAWDAMRCEKPCRNGGGSADCKIRECCKASHRLGCWECDRAEQCETLVALRPVNGNLNIDNLRRIKTIGVSGFLAESAEHKRLTFYTDPV
jgi:hypothetical protein